MLQASAYTFHKGYGMLQASAYTLHKGHGNLLVIAQVHGEVMVYGRIQRSNANCLLLRRIGRSSLLPLMFSSSHLLLPFGGCTSQVEKKIGQKSEARILERGNRLIELLLCHQTHYRCSYHHRKVHTSDQSVKGFVMDGSRLSDTTFRLIRIQILTGRSLHS